MLQVDNVLQALQEPDVNLRQLLDAFHGIAFFQRLGDSEDTQVCGVGQLVVEVFEAGVVVAHEAVHALANHAQAFLYHFLERASDGHNLAHGLHGGTNQAADAGKLGQVPAGNLANHVVQAWCHVGGTGGAHLANLVEGVAEGYLGGNEGQGVARSLGCQR